MPRASTAAGQLLLVNILDTPQLTAWEKMDMFLCTFFHLKSHQAGHAAHGRAPRTPRKTPLPRWCVWAQLLGLPARGWLWEFLAVGMLGAFSSNAAVPARISPWRFRPCAGSAAPQLPRAVTLGSTDRGPPGPGRSVH